MMDKRLEVRSVSKSFSGSNHARSYKVITDLLRSERSMRRTVLDNVSLSLRDGDRVGLLGRNGAGKSTLLKVLTGVTAPDSGQVLIEGRLLSLLEVGTGFHPELTGRENIFLSCAIFGRTKRESAALFDRIVEFSGIADHIDVPVKRYSTGMYVRLAFATVVHQPFEILLLDEILAVGDLEYQRKCVDKILTLTEKGTSTIFVSHNLDQIRRICNSIYLLERGILSGPFEVEDGIERYMHVLYSGGGSDHSGGRLKLSEFEVSPVSESQYIFRVRIRFLLSECHDEVRVGYTVRDSNGLELIKSLAEYQNLAFVEANRQYEVEQEFNAEGFIPGVYTVSAHGSIYGVEDFGLSRFASQTIEVTGNFTKKYLLESSPILYSPRQWKVRINV